MDRHADLPNKVPVLSIAHSAVSAAAGRLRYQLLAGDPEFAVTLIVPQRWYEYGRWLTADPAGSSNVTVIPLPIRLPRAGKASWYLHTYPDLRRQIRNLRPSVIHLWEEPWSLVALQASILARRAGAALVLEVDQNLAKRLPPPFEWIRRHVLARTDLVLSRSHDASAVVRGSGYAGPVLPIGYGVDQAVFRPRPSSAMLVGRRAGVPFRLGYVGRLVEEKGLDDVLAAMLQSRSNVLFSIMGEGPHEPALRLRAEAAGLDDRITFRPWSTPAKVADFMQAQDAIVLLTRTTRAVREQFGRVIVEAQACGTPVIGSSCGAIPDVVGPGGWIIPENDPKALAALLDRLQAAPDEVAACAEDGRANVAARFTHDKVADSLKQGWHQAIRCHEATVKIESREETKANIIAGCERP